MSTIKNLKDSFISLANEYRISERWREHFDELFFEIETKQRNTDSVTDQGERFYCELSNKTECRSTGVQCPECKEFESKWE